jgi:hypothetical protein
LCSEDEGNFEYEDIKLKGVLIEFGQTNFNLPGKVRNAQNE